MKTIVALYHTRLIKITVFTDYVNLCAIKADLLVSFFPETFVLKLLSEGYGRDFRYCSQVGTASVDTLETDYSISTKSVIGRRWVVTRLPRQVANRDPTRPV